MKVAKARKAKGLSKEELAKRLKVGKAIAKARRAKGLSQAKLAERLKVSAGTVGGWEAGLYGMRNERLRQLEELLDMPIEELVA